MKKKTIALSLAALVAATATGSIVYAQVAPHGPTRAEVQERTAMAFDRLDVNVDGQIDAADRAERQGERMRVRFDAADANGDGSLAFEEFSAARDNFREHRGDRRGMRHGGGHGGERGGPMAAMFMAANADANNDGAITSAEFNTAVLAQFDRADANDDGVMTRDEAMAQRQAMRAAAQARRPQGS